ncbi:MAG: YdcF family protein [Bacteroidota bacterium]
MIFLIFGNGFLFNSALHSLEHNDQKMMNISYEYGLLLGGYGEYAAQIKGLELNEGADRLHHALRLYKQRKIKKIIVLSGAYSDEYPSITEGKITVDFLKECGVPERDILLESKSRNTYENALYAKELLERENIKGQGLLISSAFHMRRANACFEAQGIQCTPYATDYRSKKENFSLETHILPSSKYLIEWRIIFKEIIGYWVYAIRGYI